MFCNFSKFDVVRRVCRRVNALLWNLVVIRCASTEPGSDSTRFDYVAEQFHAHSSDSHSIDAHRKYPNDFIRRCAMYAHRSTSFMTEHFPDG